MPKLKKQKRRQKFRHNINRKRLRNKIYGVGKIGCKEVKEAWDKQKSVKMNLGEMGLAYDPNNTIKIQNSKAKLKATMLSNINDEWQVEATEKPINKIKSHVAEELEKEAKAPRERLLQLPNSQVEWLSYLIEKYGTDFKAMERDKKNYYQETWKQLRAKIKRFRGIPTQYSQFLKERGLTIDPLENWSNQVDGDSD